MNFARFFVIFVLSLFLLCPAPDVFSQTEGQTPAPSQPAAPSPAPEQPAEVQPEAPEEEEAVEAEQPPVEPPKPGEIPGVPPQPQRQPVTPAMQLPKAPATVSFFFDDADIFEVVQTIFADVLKVNYIIDPRVKGRVNFRTVTPIPKDEVLSVIEVIFRLNGIGFVEEAGLYRIIPLEEVPRELVYAQVGKTPDKVAIEMFAFKNLDLKESMPDIETALGLHLKGGTVRIIPFYRMNALLVVASSQEQLQYIRKWVETFDSMFATARPKIYVYALQNSKADHIASLLQSIFTGTQSATTTTTAPRAEAPKGPSGTTPAPAPAPAAPRIGAGATVTGGGSFVSAETRVFADEITNSLIILSTPSDYAFIEETIRKIDIMPRQVVIEGLIAQVILTDNLSFGFRWAFQTDLRIGDIRLDNDVNINPGLATGSSGGLAVPSKGFTFVGTDPKGITRAVITALAEESRGKVLAAPHILVADNREARIQVGSQIPLATSTTTGLETTAGTITSTVQYKDIGIILKVKPQINDSGLISLELTQEVSSVSDVSTDIAGQSFTSINKTETTSNLVAQDGETIVIGGLIREDVTKAKDGIPFLSKIPIIGNLFGSTTDETTRTELIILLTPHVIRTQRDAAGVTSDYVDRYKDTTQDEDIDSFIKERDQKEKSGVKK
ncbi:MAG: secretin N-terminal domain-containing protein [Nitrospirota bacterium]